MPRTSTKPTLIDSTGAAAKLPVREKVPGHPGIWRHYKPGDKFYGPDDPCNRPTGSYYQEVMLGWTINDAGKRVPDRIRPTGDTLAELKQRIDEEKAKRQAGMAANRKAQPLAAYLRQWLCDKYSLVDLAPGDFQPSAFKKLARTRVPAAKLKSAISYNGILERHIIPALGAYRLDEVQPEHIQALVNTLAADGKGRTALYVCQVLSAAYNRAKKRRIIPWSPMEGVERPTYKSTSGAKEPLTAAEVGALLDAAQAENDPLLALWSLSAATGCRPGELLGLHRDDVHVDDPNAAFIVLRRRLIDAHDRVPLFADDTKSGAKGNARMSIDPDAAWALIAHLNRQAADRERLGKRYLDYGLVFCTEGGAPLIERNVRDDFKRALARARITRDLTFYGLRHAHATLILESGHDIKAVQARLRHSNLTVLNTTYAHVRQAMDADVANSVGKAIRGRRQA